VSRPLRFLHLTTFYPPYNFGGDGIHVQRLAHALADAGHVVHVAHCVDSYRLAQPREPTLRPIDHPRVFRHALRSPARWLSPLSTHQTGRVHFKRAALREVLATERFDVVHFHNVSLLGPEVLTLVPANPEVVKLYTAHEQWLICPTHVLWKFGRRPCEAPQCLRCTLAAKRPPQLWRYTSYLEHCYRHVDCFLSPSRFSAAIHAERGFSRPMVLLPNFADRPSGVSSHAADRPHARPYVLFAGRLEVVKGVHTLIHAWKRVEDVDLLVAGTGSREPELRANAAANPRVHFLGELPQAELGNFYAHALACVAPSVAYESFGMTVVEAFARKTPAIVRNLGALPELIEQSGAGFVYESEDELIAAVQRMAADSALRSELGRRGFAAWQKLWSTEAHLERYFELLNDAAERKLGAIPWGPYEPVAGRRAPWPEAE
jgi:glycosyltransferase involved in cell wall biosynthesis